MGSKGRGVGAHLPSVPHHSAAAMLQDPIHGQTEQLINFRGVVACGDGRFQAAINIFCNKVPLGVFDCPADAARAFDVAALALFNAAAVTNFPASSYGDSEVSTVRHALLHEHATTQPTWDNPSGTEEAGADETTHAVHPQSAANAAQQQDQTDVKPGAQHQVQQHSQPTQLAGAAPVAAATPGGAKHQPKGVASLHAQPVASERKLKRHSSSPSIDIAAGSQQHDQQQHAAPVEPAAKRRKAAANAVERARDTAETLASAADQTQQQHKQAPTPDVRPAADKHSQAPDQEQHQHSDGHFAVNAVPESTSAELTTPAAAAAAAECAAQCAKTDIKPVSAAAGEAASLAAAADIAHAHPNMLTGLLCLIDAAASLSACEQAELLQDAAQNTKLQHQQQQGASQAALTARQLSRARSDRMQQQHDGLTEQQQQQLRGHSRLAVEAAVHAAPTQRCSPAGVLSSAHGLAAAGSSGQAAAAKARSSKREPSTEHTSSDGSDCCSWDAAAAAGTATAGSTSPSSEGGGAAAASLRHSSRARKPTARIMEIDMQTLIAQPQVRKKPQTGQDPTTDEQQTKQQEQQQKLKQKQSQQQKQQQQKQPPPNKLKHNAAAKATAKAKRMQGMSTAVAAVITKGSASKIGAGPSVVKTQGPGCVSHAQNPTGQMGVRQRKGKYEAFVAVPPFRYLYLGQYETLQQAAVVRDTAMLAIFGKSAAADFGSAWLSEKGAKEIGTEAVKAMAAKLYKKEHVAPVMVAHGTHQLLQQSEG